ncbi:MAG: DNA polymerase, partial [Stellaceae bacterium]
MTDQVEMFDPIKQKPIRAPEVREKFGVDPDKVIEVQALIGDSVDNVPGVPGIGVKGAAELIGAYGSLENLLKRAEEIKQPKRRQNLIEFAEQARISKKLVTLDADVPLPLPIDALAVKPLDGKKLGTFLQTQNFRALLNRLDAQLRAAISKDAPPPAPATPAPAPAGANGAMAVAVPETLAAAKPAYEIVYEMAQLERWIARALAEGTVAVAVEAATPDAMRAELLGLALAIEPGAACYIPLARRAPVEGLDLGDVAAKQIPRERALEQLKVLLEDPGILKVAHNAKFAIEVLHRRGVVMTPVDDTLLLSFVLEGGRHGHDLDELAPLHFGHEMIKLRDLVGSGKSQIDFATVPLDRARDFAAEQADYALRLHRLLRPRLVAEHMVSFYETVERPLAPVVAEMESAGIMVDRARLHELSKDFAGRMVELEREIYRLAGHEFNLGSPKQLGEVLFDE